jgi:hypothetical protein
MRAGVNQEHPSAVSAASNTSLVMASQLPSLVTDSRPCAMQHQMNGYRDRQGVGRLWPLDECANSKVRRLSQPYPWSYTA